ncbi:MAG: hypothetical protein QXJ68_06840 [Methanocellales archaeon]
MGEVAGICSFCRNVGSLYTCSLCGAIVCKICYVPQRRICKRCAREFGVGERRF